MLSLRPVIHQALYTRALVHQALKVLRKVHFRHQSLHLPYLSSHHHHHRSDHPSQSVNLPPKQYHSSRQVPFSQQLLRLDHRLQTRLSSRPPYHHPTQQNTLHGNLQACLPDYLRCLQQASPLVPLRWNATMSKHIEVRLMAYLVKAITTPTVFSGDFWD